MMISGNLPVADDGQFVLDRELVCQLFGVSRATVNAWLKEDNPPPRVDGRYPARDLGEWIRKHQTLKSSRGGAHPYLPDGVVILEPHAKVSKGLPSVDPSGVVAPIAQKTLKTEQLRTETLKADKLEMELAQSRGELIPADEVEKGWADILSRLKTRIMQIPYTAAMMVVGDNDMSSVQEKIKSITTDALLELSADWRENEDDDE